MTWNITSPLFFDKHLRVRARAVPVVTGEQTLPSNDRARD